MALQQLPRAYQMPSANILPCLNSNLVYEATVSAQGHDDKIYLTTRFHVPVRLLSNRSQMTSKCGKNKKSGTRGVAECVTDVLTTF